MQGLLHANDIKLVRNFSTIDFYMHTAGQFSLSNNVTASAESVDGPTPTVRVTWNTTAPPECVTSVRVVFRNNSLGSVVATYTTTNTSSSTVIQTDLQCNIVYYITVNVIGATSDGRHSTMTSRPVQVFAGGKKKIGMHEIQSQQHNGATVIAQISPHQLE